MACTSFNHRMVPASSSIQYKKAFLSTKYILPSLTTGLKTLSLAKKSHLIWLPGTIISSLLPVKKRLPLYIGQSPAKAMVAIVTMKHV